VTLAESWNGTAWTIQATPSPAGFGTSILDGVSCNSSTACTAVGYSDNPGESLLAESWNGTAWTIQATPLPAGGLGGILVGVSCSSSSACIAVGHYANSANTNVSLAEGWNGTAWSVQTVPAPPDATTNVLNGVSCTSSVACKAFGWNYLGGGEIPVPLAEVWKGTSWSIKNTPPPPDNTGTYPTGVSCSTSKSCMAAGFYFNASDAEVNFGEKWNGTSWSVHNPRQKDGFADAMYGVSCSSATACTATGGYSNGTAFVALTERWNGTSWAVQKTAKTGTASILYGVSCSAPAACTAVGDYTNSSGTVLTLAEGWNGTSWAIQATPNP
jgi:hypothetical protein